MAGAPCKSFDSIVICDTQEKAFPIGLGTSQLPRWCMGKVSQPAPF